MSDLRERIARLDLPLPLEPLIAGARVASDADEARERWLRAASLVFQLCATTLWTLSRAPGRRTRITEGTLAEWGGLLVQECAFNAAGQPGHPSAELYGALNAPLDPDGALHAWAADHVEDAKVATVRDVVAYVARPLATGEHVTLESLDASVLAAFVVALVESVPVIAGHSLVVVDRCARTDDGTWRVESTRMHGGSPQLDEREVSALVADGLTEGEGYLVDAAGHYVPLRPWVLAESTAVTVRLGWLAGRGEQGVRYATHLAGDLFATLTQAEHDELFAGEPPTLPVRTDGTGRRKRARRPRSVRVVRWIAAALAATAAAATLGWAAAVRERRAALGVAERARTALVRAERTAALERDGRTRAERSLAEVARQVASIQTAVSSPEAPTERDMTTARTLTSAAAERRAQALLIAANAGHEAEALSAAVRATGQALSDGLPVSGQAVDALAGAVAALRHSYPIHTRHDGRWSAQLSSDGRRALVATEDNHFQIWDTARRHVVAQLQPTPEDVVRAEFSHDGSRLLTWTFADHPVLWDAHRGRVILDPGQSRGVAAFSPDGSHVVVGAVDGTVEVFDARNGQTSADFSGHSGAVRHATFRDDGRLLATSSDDGTVRIWSLDAGTEQARIDTSADTPFLAFLGGEARLITASNDPGASSAPTPLLVGAHGLAPSSASRHAAVQLWDTTTGASVARIDEAWLDPPAIIAHSGVRFVTRTVTSGAVLWDTRSGARIATLAPDATRVGAIAFSPDASLIAVMTADGTQLVDTAHGTAQRPVDLRGQGDATVLRFSPDGTLLFGVGTDGAEALFDVETGERDALLRDATGGVQTASFHDGGQRLLTVGRDQSVRVWDSDGGELIERVAAFTGPVIDAHFAGDDTHVAAASADGTVRLWDEDAGQTLTSFRHSVVLFAKDGTRALIAGSGAPRIVRLPSEHVIFELTAAPTGTRAARFSFDGTTLALADRHGTATVWNVEDGTLLRTVNAGDGAHEPRMSISQDATRLLVAQPNGHASLWDLTTGTRLAGYDGELFQVTSLTLSPDGTRLLLQGSDGVIELRDPMDGRLLARLGETGVSVTDVQFSPDGTLIATASPDAPVKLWDGHDGHERASIDEFASVARFSPDGHLLALAVDGGARANTQSDVSAAVRLWDLSSRRIVASVVGHPGAITSIAFALDGSRIATTSDDRTACIWDVATGARMATLLGHGSEVSSAAFSADGSLLQTTSGDGTVRIYPADGAGFLAMGCSLLHGQPDPTGARRFCGGGHRDHDHDAH